MHKYLLRILPLFVTALFLGLSFFSYYCVFVTKLCYGSWLGHIYEYFTQPLYNFSLPVLFVVIVIVFVPWSLFKTWLKFAAWFLPLSFLFIFITPVSSTRLGIDFFPYYRVNAAHDAGIAFVVLSLLILAWSYYRLRKVKGKPA